MSGRAGKWLANYRILSWYELYMETSGGHASMRSHQVLYTQLGIYEVKASHF